MSGRARNSIAVVAKTGSQEIRFSFDEFKGAKFVSIRTFVRDRQTGDMVPTKAGVTFNPDLLPAVQQALEQVVREVGTKKADRP